MYPEIHQFSHGKNGRGIFGISHGTSMEYNATSKSKETFFVLNLFYKGSSIKDVRKEGGGGSREKGHVRT